MPEYPVFIKRGDARPELDGILRELGATPEAAGLVKYIFVANAAQTVAMVAGLDVPLARRLRGRPGWTEPGRLAGN